MTSRNQGPWTDIYSLSATLYFAICGKRPDDAPSRIVEDELLPASQVARGAYRPGFLNAIDAALQLKVDRRPQSIASWRDQMFAPAPSVRQDQPAPTQVAQAGGPYHQSPMPAAALAVAGAAAMQLQSPDQLPKSAPERQPACGPGPSARTPPANNGAAARPVRNRRRGLMADLGRREQKAAAAKPQVTGPRVAGPLALTMPASSPAPPRQAGGTVPQLAVPQRKAPRPRPIRRKGSSRLRPLLIKALIVIGLASTAVAMRDRLPYLADLGLNLFSSFGAPPALVPRLTGHQGSVDAVAFNADASRVISSGADGTLRVWNAIDGTLIRKINMKNGPAGAFAIAGNRVATGHKDGTAVLWDLKSGVRLTAFKRNQAQIWSIAFAGTPDLIATASHDWAVTLWDGLAKDAPLHVFKGHKNAVQAVAYSASSGLIASGGADETVRLWNAQTRQLLRTYRNLPDFVTAIAFSADGRALAVACLDGNVRIYATTSTRTKRKFSGHAKRVTSLAFSPDSKYLATASLDGSAKIWNAGTGVQLNELRGHTGAVKSVAYSGDGRHLATAGSGGTIRIWKTAGLLTSATTRSGGAESDD